ncbi:MAG: sigma-70 family RNA polymerase sigma factor [Planctomycetes bacterium]|nr:sigma-70 family RNA polymerase sigma factor [Planctomycetota bacterium]
MIDSSVAPEVGAPSALHAPFAVPRAAVERARSVARRLAGCDHVADDILQDALIAAWQLAAPPPAPGAWLLRAVVLRCRQAHRAARRRRQHEHNAGCHLHRGCDNPLHHAVAHELGDRLAQALSRLPAEQQQAFELYVDTGLDYAGVAAALAVPLGTVRSRLHRARLALLANVGAGGSA